MRDPASGSDGAAKQRAGARTASCSGITWRSLLISTLLIPANAFWVLQMERVRYSAHPTTVSLLFNAVFILLVLTAANFAFGRLFPRRRLSQAELLPSMRWFAWALPLQGTISSRCWLLLSHGPTGLPHLRIAGHLCSLVASARGCQCKTRRRWQAISTAIPRYIHASACSHGRRRFSCGRFSSPRCSS